MKITKTDLIEIAGAIITLLALAFCLLGSAFL